MKSANSYRYNNYRLFFFLLIFLLCFTAVGCSTESKQAVSIKESFPTPDANAININTASTAELERIPYIGEKLALKIVEYREKHGPFRKAEHLMLIQGISDKKFRQISNLVRVD